MLLTIISAVFMKGWVLRPLSRLGLAGRPLAIGELIFEAIMTVRNLTNGRTWTPSDIDRALCSHALTTVMMTRFHVVERVKRSLSTDLSRPSKVA